MRSLQHLPVRGTDADGRPGVCVNIMYTRAHCTPMTNESGNEMQLVSRDT